MPGFGCQLQCQWWSTSLFQPRGLIAAAICNLSVFQSAFHMQCPLGKESRLCCSLPCVSCHSTSSSEIIQGGEPHKTPTYWRYCAGTGRGGWGGSKRRAFFFAHVLVAIHWRRGKHVKKIARESANPGTIPGTIPEKGTLVGVFSRSP